MNIKCIFPILMLACYHSTAQEEPDDIPMTGQYALTKITVQIIGENDLPIEGADVNIRFPNVEEYKDGFNDFHGKSDKNGLFSGESKITGSYIDIIAKKEGYYFSEKHYQHPREKNPDVKVGHKMQPWNPTIPVILKKIGKPVPLIARTMPESRYLSRLDKGYGFDMVSYDWVKPHGAGEHADLMIEATLNAKDDENYTAGVEIRFPNQNDGWIALDTLHGTESTLKYPREAPIDGYQNAPIKLGMIVKHGFDQMSVVGGHPYGYILRLRTKKNSIGEIESAIYARIVDRDARQIDDKRRLQNPISIQASPRILRELDSGAIINIPYYLNPKINDRRLEFDRTNNLAEEVQIEAQNIAP